MIIRCIDFETTGFPPKAGVCEAGWTDVTVTADGVAVGATVSHLCRPGLPIGAEAMKVHGITEEMVADAPASASVFMKMMDGANVFCAHNAEFEQKFFTGGDKPWACTYKIALARKPGLSSYKCGNLPGLLGIDLDPDRCAPLHRAGPDTYVTAMILSRLLSEGLTVPEAIAISLGPKAISVMPFGKHKGTRVQDLPDSYLIWGIENLQAGDISAAFVAEQKRRNLPQ